ncbi:MAG TPA: NADH-quinone oxidoreductase subunit L [Candidatus Paceibacterota bacterium]|nr:NADH-quinone oxidoreductase subunit L [Verrucomicrobiota bacterium]HSA12299.1 NADH-quinone oxidoreductase subunit L [Candidatus Paceibacterota bacterium]
MDWIVHKLWLIPVLPLLAAGLSVLLKQRQRRLSASLAIGAMILALVLSCLALANAVQQSGRGLPVRLAVNFFWFEFGDPQMSDTALRLGWVLDPLGAIMLVMVSFVGLLIFIYSLGYMAGDENFTRFFCFLSLFAAGMLGLVIANSLMLLFMCWELVGLTSYLLIGFWYRKPSAVAAAKKAFITTRVGDLALLLGMVWLYAETGTLLFYDGGKGCLEQTAHAGLVTQSTILGMTVSTGISLLIFCGAVGKSGQVPLHVWLPDAMEGPTPVSALIHAATMVAAGVFLVARVYPLMEAHPEGATSAPGALQVVTWVGALTAVFAASIAVAQTDIKRILAYSTVSQLGFMMLGLGTGGAAVGMFHLVTHAFFKALLFLGAGSVIHGCHDEQDIRRMGGLRTIMPVTFGTYAVGMLALSGFPLLFSGFWSKDGVLHSAHIWGVSHWPFYLGVAGALLTAFYMTRQLCYVFFGSSRVNRRGGGHFATANERINRSGSLQPGCEVVHESPRVMTIPLIMLAAGSIFLGFIGTPAWPWFQGFLAGQSVTGQPGRLCDPEVLRLMVFSSAGVFIGLGLGWWLYGRKPVATTNEPDALERLQPEIFALLRRKYFVDEIYEASVVRFNAWGARACNWLDYWLWNGAVQMIALLVVGLAWVSRVLDEYGINAGFDESCRRLTNGGALMSRVQCGQVQRYLRLIAVALTVFVLFLIWGCRRP